MTGSASPDGPARLSLLDQIVADALEPDYARAHAAADLSGTGGRRERNGHGRRVLHVGVVLVLLVSGFVVALAVSDVRRRAPEASATRQQLLSQVTARTATTDTLAAEVAALRADVAGARDAALATTRTGRLRSDQLARLELVTGAVPVTGPGVRVSVQDAPPADASSQDQADLGKVQDRDLQLVVNGLWAAGAEAVAVGGYRVTARTAIRSAGEAILVDFRPISQPYVVEAIGDPDRLRAAFLDGPGGRALDALSSTYGIRFSTESVASLTLPAAVSLGDVAGATTGGQQ